MGSHSVSTAVSKKFGVRIGRDTLPKVQRTQGIENFDTSNTFSSKQKQQQTLEFLSNLSLLFWHRAKST